MAVQRDKVIASAEKLVAKGKIEPAIKEYERLLDDNPNDVNTLNRIGDLWVRINRNDEAVKVFGKIADHYSRDGFFLKAIAIYKKINKLDPSKLDIYAKLADLYAKQGLAMEAKSQYQVLADYYLKHGDPGNALLIYRKISELDPNSINVHVKLADLYSQNNQTLEALKEYDRVGRMLLKRGMLDEAGQVFRKALKIDAGNVELVDSLATTLIEAKDYDAAAQIAQQALEVNKDNPRLLALLGRIYLAKGDAGQARQALERGLATNPTDSALRDALADLYLRLANPDKALEMLAPVAEKALSKGDRGGAVEVLNRVLRVDAGHTLTLERLVALYVRLNEETNILTAMNSLAEAHMGRGQYDQAAMVLEKLIDREPQNAQHRNKLSFVRSQMGGADTIPHRARTAHSTPLPPPVSRQMEIEEPMPSLDSFDEPSMELDLDSSAPMELDFELDTTPAPPPVSIPQPPSPPVLTTSSSLMQDADEAGDDLDFITEHLTEAEVFAKYGLAEKAAEHLRAVIERSPRNLPAHDKLFRILLDEGDIEGARAAATAYVAVLEEKSDGVTAAAVRTEFVNRGKPLGGSAPSVAPRRPITVERPIPVPEPSPEPLLATDLGASDEISFDLDGGTDFELDSVSIDPPAAPAPTVAAVSPVEAKGEFDLDFDTGLSFEEESVAPEFSLQEDDFSLPDVSSFSLDTPAVAEPAPSPEPEPEPALEPEPVPATSDFTFDLPATSLPSFEPLADEPSFSFDEPDTAVEDQPALTAEDSLFDSDFGATSTTFIDEPALEEIGEIDFYIEQELFDEARGKLDALMARYPDHEELQKRQARVQDGLEAIAASATSAAAPANQTFPSGPTPASLSRDEIESELLSAIPDDDDDIVTFVTPAPPPPASAVAASISPPPAAHEENLFADEDDFFDLAAELESELEEDEEPISLSEEEQSLEEIFKEFKKGVEQQLDSEDYDTHYNLGIAYKEMGLIDEAIGEFQLASKDPKRAVECASMLGLCFLEKGMPQLAIKWYRKGLELVEISEDEHVGMLYDLGSAYMEVGDIENAQKSFTEVYGMNTNYRDIVGRIKQLEDARK